MALELLTVTERRTLDAYSALLRERLGDDLPGIWVFGSVAIDATFPLFLESGRQIGPQFRTREQLGRTPAFVENVRREAVEVWRHPTRPVTV